jgi:hypothetical protein
MAGRGAERYGGRVAAGRPCGAGRPGQPAGQGGGCFAPGSALRTGGRAGPGTRFDEDRGLRRGMLSAGGRVATGLNIEMKEIKGF